MDKSRFTDAMTGELVRITVPEPDWAFVPNPLPPNWEFSAALWPLLAEAKEQLGRLDGIGRTLRNPELLLAPLRQREAMRSSSLEGTYASPKELLLYELNPKEPKSASDSANEWREVSNYSRALREGRKTLSNDPLSARFIRQLHTWLLTGVRGGKGSPGQFRKYQVHVGSDGRFIPPPPGHRLDQCLHDFEKWLRGTHNAYDPLIWCYIIHYQFEAIHPFTDGNGRVGRLLLAIMTYALCDLYEPWLYMSAFFERYKDEYIERLFEVSTKGNWEAWIRFCIQGTTVQAKDAIKRCDRLRRLNDDFHERISGGSIRLHPMIDDLFTIPVVTIPQVRRKFGVAYQTAKGDVERLAKVGILKPVQDAFPKTFYTPEVWAIAYSEEGKEQEE